MTQEQTNAYLKGFKVGWNKAEERVNRLLEEMLNSTKYHQPLMEELRDKIKHHSVGVKEKKNDNDRS